MHTAENNTQITLELNLETTLIKIYLAQPAYVIELIDEMLEFAIGSTQ